MSDTWHTKAAVRYGDYVCVLLNGELYPVIGWEGDCYLVSVWGKVVKVRARAALEQQND